MRGSLRQVMEEKRIEGKKHRPRNSRMWDYDGMRFPLSSEFSTLLSYTDLAEGRRVLKIMKSV